MSEPRYEVHSISVDMWAVYDNDESVYVEAFHYRSNAEAEARALAERLNLRALGGGDE